MCFFQETESSLWSCDYWFWRFVNELSWGGIKALEQCTGLKLLLWGILQRHTGIVKMWHCLSFQTLLAWIWLVYSKEASLEIFIILHPTAWYYTVRRCTWLPCLVSEHQACREVSRFFPNGLARTVSQSVDNENTIKPRQKKKVNK